MTATLANPNALMETLVSVVYQVIGRPAGDGFNLDLVAKLAAGVTSSQYLYSRMQGAHRAENGTALIDFSCAAATVDGLVLEFGVFSGKSINRIAEHKTGPVYGFDSFEGLPEDWRAGYEKGRFNRADLPAVAPNVELIVGWFDRTLPKFLDEHPGPVSLIHMDCDLYTSTQTTLTQLRQRIVPGTIILFDEYFNYPGWEMHEHKAFREFVESWDVQYEYIGLNPNHQQVAVRITGIRH
jgi:predicted O-methyltransferase YrrM